MQREVESEILDELSGDDPRALRSRRDLRREKGKVIGLDLQTAPPGLEDEWIFGDLFETLEEAEGNTVVANLILHHFQDDALRELGELLRKRRRLVMVEPWRSRVALAEGYALWPLVNQVTRHDMMVSIRAGFRRGELQDCSSLGMIGNLLM